MKRPLGFREFIEKEGFHTVYLVTTERDSPVKVGIAADPAERFAHIQFHNFVRLRLHRVWWMAGRKISERTERAFKNHFAPRCIRGEWFDLPLGEAESFVEVQIRKFRTWGVPEADVVEFMEHCERRRLDFLRG